MTKHQLALKTEQRLRDEIERLNKIVIRQHREIQELEITSQRLKDEVSSLEFSYS